MTHKEFVMWLDGFLTNKKSLNIDDIRHIQNKMDDIMELETRTVIPPVQWPDLSAPFNPPFDPQCETGKQLLKDGR